MTGGPDVTYGAKDFTVRKRQDGGYTLAHGGISHAEIVPDSFRLALQFLPALKHQWGDVHLRLGSRFVEEAGYAQRWSLDEVTPFERHRVLDPKPHAATARKIQANAARHFPAFAQAEIAQTWAGLIDVTPDAIPVISPVDSAPGLFISTGYSGHGFGIGPAAGRLMADLVTGATPCVDPTAFRLSRFTDGSKTILDDGF